MIKLLLKFYTWHTCWWYSQSFYSNRPSHQTLRASKLVQVSSVGWCETRDTHDWCVCGWHASDLVWVKRGRNRRMRLLPAKPFLAQNTQNVESWIRAAKKKIGLGNFMQLRFYKQIHPRQRRGFFLLLLKVDQFITSAICQSSQSRSGRFEDYPIWIQ